MVILLNWRQVGDWYCDKNDLKFPQVMRPQAHYAFEANHARRQLAWLTEERLAALQQSLLTHARLFSRKERCPPLKKLGCFRT